MPRSKKNYDITSGDDVYVVYYREVDEDYCGVAANCRGMHVFATKQHAMQFIRSHEDELNLNDWCEWDVDGFDTIKCSLIGPGTSFGKFRNHNDLLDCGWGGESVWVYEVDCNVCPKGEPWSWHSYYFIATVIRMPFDRCGFETVDEHTSLRYEDGREAMYVLDNVFDLWSRSNEKEAESLLARIRGESGNE